MMGSWVCTCGFDADKASERDRSENVTFDREWSQKHGFEPSDSVSFASPKQLYRKHVLANRTCLDKHQARVLKWALRRRLPAGNRICLYSLKKVPDWVCFSDLLVTECHECGDHVAIDPSTSKQPRVLCPTCRHECRQRTFQAARDKKRVEHQSKQCERCGEAFQPMRSTAKFCSTKCRVYASRHS